MVRADQSKIVVLVSGDTAGTTFFRKWDIADKELTTELLII